MTYQQSINVTDEAIKAATEFLRDVTSEQTCDTSTKSEIVRSVRAACLGFLQVTDSVRLCDCADVEDVKPPHAITAHQRDEISRKMQEIRANKDEWLADKGDLNKEIYAEHLGLSDSEIDSLPCLNELLVRDGE